MIGEPIGGYAHDVDYDENALVPVSSGGFPASITLGSDPNGGQRMAIMRVEEVDVRDGLHRKESEVVVSDEELPDHGMSLSSDLLMLFFKYFNVMHLLRDEK